MTYQEGQGTIIRTGSRSPFGQTQLSDNAHPVLGKKRGFAPISMGAVGPYRDTHNYI